VGAAPAPDWLDTQGLHAQLLGRECRNAADTTQAARRYAALLESDPALQIWPGALQQQIYLGDDAFVGRMQALGGLAVSMAAAAEVPRIQRRPPHRPLQAAGGGSQPPAESWLIPSAARTEALCRAYREEGVTMTALAARCGLSVSRVSRLIAAVEGAKGKT
jgi:hypothetical protein